MKKKKNDVQRNALLGNACHHLLGSGAVSPYVTASSPHAFALDWRVRRLPFVGVVGSSGSKCPPAAEVVLPLSSF